jgi:hypothetical protein
VSAVASRWRPRHAAPRPLRGFVLESAERVRNDPKWGACSPGSDDAGHERAVPKLMMMVDPSRGHVRPLRFAGTHPDLARLLTRTSCPSPSAEVRPTRLRIQRSGVQNSSTGPSSGAPSCRLKRAPGPSSVRPSPGAIRQTTPDGPPDVQSLRDRPSYPEPLRSDVADDRGPKRSSAAPDASTRSMRQSSNARGSQKNSRRPPTPRRSDVQDRVQARLGS